MTTLMISVVVLGVLLALALITWRLEARYDDGDELEKRLYSLGERLADMASQRD